MIIRPSVVDKTCAGSIQSYALPNGIKRLSIVVETPDASVSYGFDDALDDAIVIAPGDSHTPIDLEDDVFIEPGTVIYFSSDVNPTDFSLLVMEQVANG